MEGPRGTQINRHKITRGRPHIFQHFLDVPLSLHFPTYSQYLFIFSNISTIFRQYICVRVDPALLANVELKIERQTLVVRQTLRERPPGATNRTARIKVQLRVTIKSIDILLSGWEIRIPELGDLWPEGPEEAQRFRHPRARGPLIWGS